MTLVSGIILLLLLLLHESRSSDPTKRWYLGCYIPTLPGPVPSKLYIDDSSLIPAKCSNMCAEQRFDFAFVSKTRCYCDTNLSKYSQTNEIECDQGCSGDPNQKCGGSGKFGLFSVQGPYVSMVIIRAPEKYVVNKEFEIEIRIFLTSDFDFPTGLSYNLTFDHVEVNVQNENRSIGHHVVAMTGREGSLQILYVFRTTGVKSITVEARNAISFQTRREIISIFSRVPSSVDVTDITNHRFQPSCTPSYFNSDHNQFETLESTSVVTGNSVTIQARVFSGVNLTFDWNFCNLARVSATPYKDEDRCKNTFCQSNKQSFIFNQSGLCEVIVNVHNKFTQVSSSIHVAVISPQIKDLSFDLKSCSSPKCEFSAPTLLTLSLKKYLNDPLEQDLQPPWLLEGNSFIPRTTATTTTTEAPTTPGLPTGTYFVNTKVCFQARVYISMRLGVSGIVDFGDGTSKKYGLNERRSYEERYRRDVETTENDNREELGSPGSEQQLPDQSFRQGIFGYNSFRTNDNKEEISACYDHGCMFSLHFSHEYKTPGRYRLNMTVSNKTDQLFAVLNQPLLILDIQNMNLGRMLCDPVVALGELVEFSIEHSVTKFYIWYIEKCQAGMETTENCGPPTVIESSSTLQYTFTSSGSYKIRIQTDNEADNLYPRFCDVIVEQPIQVHPIAFDSERNYYFVNDSINVFLNVKKGSNFTVTWHFGEEVLCDQIKHNNPLELTHRFTSNTPGCKNISVELSNTVSHVTTPERILVCFEERISGLRLLLPDDIRTSGPMNLTVAMSSGSHVMIDVILKCSDKTIVEEFRIFAGIGAGPSVHNFTSLLIQSSSYYEIELRAHNHVTRSVVHRRIAIGRAPFNVTLVPTPSFGYSLINERVNLVTVLLDGVVEDSKSLVYEWIYPNNTDVSESVVTYTTSPVINVKPICNRSLSSQCFLNLTIKSGSSVTSSFLRIYSESYNATKRQSSMCYSAAVSTGSNVSLLVSCLSSCCKITFPSENITTSCINDTNPLVYHTFNQTGLQIMRLETLLGRNKTHVQMNYISVQEKIKNIAIEGDSVLYGENATGRWRAVVENGTNLVYTWKVRKQGEDGFRNKMIKSTCSDKFWFRFNESGVFEVVLDVSNDLNREEVVRIVELHATKNQFEVMVKPVYFGNYSIFLLRSDTTSTFTLKVVWSEGGSEEFYSLEELQEVTNVTRQNNSKHFYLPHRYSTSGHHQFLFTLLPSDDASVRKFSGVCRIYEPDRSPVTFFLYVNQKSESLWSPYSVIRNDNVSIVIETIDVVSSITWSLYHSGQSLKRGIVSTNHNPIILNFIAFNVGTYRFMVQSHPNNFNFDVDIHVLAPVTELILDRPYSNKIERYVNYCELKEAEGESSCKITFRVKSDGSNVTYQFRFQPIGTQFIDNDTVYVIATPRNEIFPEHSVFKQSAEVSYTFTESGNYNISVAVFLNYKWGTQDAPYLISSLEHLFRVESTPNVSFPDEDFFAEVRKASIFRLKKLNPKQVFRIDWDMGDETVYRDAGSQVTHVYNEVGKRTMKLRIYNTFTQMYLSKEVKVEASLERVTVSIISDSLILATNKKITFSAEASPSETATKYKWYFTKKDRRVTYQPLFDYEYKQPGDFLIQVEAMNGVSSVKSTPRAIQVVEPVKDIFIYTDPVIEVGKLNQFRIFGSMGSDIKSSWYMGDGAEFFLEDNAEIKYSYSRPGVYTVRVTVGNSYNSVEDRKVIFVMVKPCQLPEVRMSNDGYRQYYRENPMWFEAEVESNCSAVTGINYHWSIARIGRLKRQFDLTNLRGTNVNSKILRLQPRTFEPGNYSITVNVSFPGTFLYNTKINQFTIKENKIPLEFFGGFSRTLSRSSNVTLRVLHPDIYGNLRYSWKCFVIDHPSEWCFINKSASINYSNNRELLLSKRLDPSVHSHFPFPIDSTEDFIVFPAKLFIDNRHTFAFQVNVSSPLTPHLSNTALTVLILTEEPQVARVDISCPSCIQSSMVKHMGGLFAASCSNCDSDNVTYSWRISLVQDDAKIFYKHGSEDCAAPDGSGWQKYITNSSSNATVFQHNIVQVDTLFEQSGNGNDYEFELHPDDANFTGILPDDKPFNLRSSPANGYKKGVSPQNKQERNDLNHLSSLNPYSPESSINDGLNLTTGTDEQLLKKPSNLSSLLLGASNTRQGSFSDLSRYLFEGNTKYRFRDLLTSGTQSNNNPFQNPFSVQQNYVRPDRRFFNDLVSLSSESETIGGDGSDIVNQQLDPTGYDGGDNLIDSSIPSSFDIPEHFQNFKLISIPLKSVAQVKGKGNLLEINPNTLAEGKTYSVTAAGSQGFANGTTKRGESSFYFRVMRGPSYGACTLLNETRNDTFKIYCFQWKNKQNRVLDNLISENEMLSHEFRYSLTRNGEQRPIYYGPYYDINFQLPQSKKPVYLHAVLYNSQGAKTSICTLALNVTRPETKTNQSALDDLNFVYSSAVGNKSKLQHYVAIKDENAILGFINVLTDSLPEPNDLTRLRTSSQGNMEKKMENITDSIVNNLASLPFVDLNWAVDLVSTVSRILRYKSFFNYRHVKKMFQLLTSTVLAVTESVQVESRYRSNLGNLAKSIQDQGKYKSFLEGLFRNFEEIFELVGVNNSQTESTKTWMEYLSITERILRHCIIDLEAVKLSIADTILHTSNNRYLFVQKADHSSFLNIGNSSVGMKLPKSQQMTNVTGLLSSGLIYMNINPFFSATQTITPQLDSSAISLWIMDFHHRSFSFQDLVPPIIIKLPPRINHQTNKSSKFQFFVDRNHISVHSFNASHADMSTLHIELHTEDAEKREFPVIVALSSVSLTTTASLDDKSIIDHRVLFSRRKSEKRSSSKIKFTFKPGYLPYTGKYYFSLWSKTNLTSSKVGRMSKQTVKYNLNIWWSDCFYWKEAEQVWNKDGCQALNYSTAEQTFCSSTHLTTFTSSFEKVQISSYKIKRTFEDTITTLSMWSSILLSFLLLNFLVFLLLNKKVLVKNQNSNNNHDYPLVEEKPLNICDWLRWWVGTDNTGEDGKIPVILRDNKEEDNQVFEIIVQTGCWPGSGTTSIPYVILYGEAGTYEPRELTPPSRNEGSISGCYDSNEKECFFETGSSKTFIMTFSQSLGRLTRLNIWHDHSGWRPGWFFDYIIVRDVISGEKWYFSYRSWLALDRGCGKIGVDLIPLERRPKFLEQLSGRVQNYLLELHSLVSLFAFPRWASLTRTQRMVHFFTLSMALLALSMAKHSIFSLEIDNEIVARESLCSGLIIALLANIILFPAHLIFRFTEKDDRVLVMMEDDTNDKSSLSSQVDIDYSGTQQDNRVQTGGLRKTAATEIDLYLLDDVYDDFTQCRNDVISDWLKKDLYGASSSSLKDPAYSVCSSQHDGGYMSRQSFISYTDDEITRCMSPRSASTCSAAVEYPPYRNAYLPISNTWSSGRKPSVPISDVNFQPTHDDQPEEDDFFAMDGPALVPCETLDPVHQTTGGTLPYRCAQLAMAYYCLLIGCAVATLIALPKLTIFYIDYKLWIETSLYSFFWSFLVVEILHVVVLAFFRTVQNFIQKRNFLETASELFPTVEAVSVDDYVYKSRTGDDVFVDADDNLNAIDSSQINLQVTERQRCRYLRNIHPPYNEKGKWRNKNDKRRKISRILKKIRVVKQAGTSWRTFLFLALIFFVCLGYLDLQNQNRLRQSLLVKKWVRSGFKVNENLLFCGNCINKREKKVKFYDISNFDGWKHWFQTNWNLHRNTFSSSTANTQCNTVVLGSIKILLNLKTPSPNRCHNLPTAMQTILLDTKPCNQTFPNQTASNSMFTNPDVTYIDLTKVKVNETLRVRSQYQPESVELRFVLYNKANRIYSLVKTFSSFANRFRKSEITVQSTQLNVNDSNLYLAVSWLLLFWCISFGLSGLINLLEKAMWRKTYKHSWKNLGENIKLIDFFLWVTVVSYIFLSSVYRQTIISTSECLEKTGHLAKETTEIIETVLNMETMTRQTLAFFSLLLLLKLLTILLNFHARRTNYNRGLFALKLSMQNICTSWLLNVTAIALLVTIIFLLVVIFFYDVKVVCDIVLTPFFHLWLTFFGTRKSANDSQFTLFQQLNANYKAPIFVFLLFILRMFVKALLIACHRWYYHAIKALECPRKKNKSKMPRKKNILGEKRKSALMKSSKKRNKKRSKILNQSRFPKCNHVTFKQIFQEDLKNFSSFIGYFPQFVNQHFAFMKEIARKYESFDTTINRSNSPSGNDNSPSSFDYDKTKLDDEFYPYDIPTHFDSFLENNSDNAEKHSDEGQIKIIEFPDEDAFSEFELQVKELAAKATPLVEEEMEILLASKKDADASIMTPEEDLYSLLVKVIVEKLMKAKNRSRAENDDLATIVTSSDFSVSETSLIRFRNRKTSHLSLIKQCEDTAPKISVNRNLSLPFDRIREINNFDSRPRNDVAKSLTSLKTTKVSFFDKKERNNCKDFKENIRISSDQEEESSSFLTTLNIAKHNHQLHRKREHSPGHSPNSTISPGNSFIESFGSSSSESHHTEDHNEKKAGHLGSGIWRSLLGIKKRKTSKITKLTSKRGTLHRSQTVFIDVKDLPVLHTSPSSSEMSSQTFQKVAPKEKPRYRRSSQLGSDQSMGNSTSSERESSHENLHCYRSPSPDVFLHDHEEFHHRSPRNLPGCVDETVFSSSTKIRCFSAETAHERHHADEKEVDKRRSQSTRSTHLYSNQHRPSVILEEKFVLCSE